MVGYGPRLSNKKRCKVGIFARAKVIIEAKIKNSLSFLLSMRDVYAFSDEELRGMAHSLQCIDQASSVDEVMGFEGNAAKCYFQCYSKLALASVLREGILGLLRTPLMRSFHTARAFCIEA